MGAEKSVKSGPKKINSICCKFIVSAICSLSVKEAAAKQTESRNFPWCVTDECRLPTIEGLFLKEGSDGWIGWWLMGRTVTVIKSCIIVSWHTGGDGDRAHVDNM